MPSRSRTGLYARLIAIVAAYSKNQSWSSSGRGTDKRPADVAATAKVGIGPRSAGGFGITTDLTVSLPGLDRDDAQKLIDAAYQICPYSNATRGNVDVGLTLA